MFGSQLAVLLWKVVKTLREVRPCWKQVCRRCFWQSCLVRVPFSLFASCVPWVSSQGVCGWRHTSHSLKQSCWAFYHWVSKCKEHVLFLWDLKVLFNTHTHTHELKRLEPSFNTETDKVQLISLLENIQRFKGQSKTDTGIGWNSLFFFFFWLNGCQD